MGFGGRELRFGLGSVEVAKLVVEACFEVGVWVGGFGGWGAWVDLGAPDTGGWISF